MSHETSSFLRRVLIADGAISGATAPLLLLGAPLLERMLGVPESLLRYAGVSLIPFAVYVVYLSRREYLSRGSVWGVIALNLAWAVGSVLLVFSVEASRAGAVFILAQAIAVAVFAEMQYVGLRRSVAA